MPQNNKKNKKRIQQHPQQKKNTSFVPTFSSSSVSGSIASAKKSTTTNNNMLNETFYSNGVNGAIRRIRTPSQHDVLSGRGGSVNAHPGNIQFREWVAERKTDYNLAHNKQDKAIICRDVIAKVVSLGGRFLGREHATSQFWIEQDEERIMAKTSQALREGAPKIRIAHQDDEYHNSHHHDDVDVMEIPTQDQRDETNIVLPVQTISTMDVLPIPCNMKRVRVNYNGNFVRPNQETPPLKSIPTSTLAFPPPPLLSLSCSSSNNTNNHKTSHLQREHSLACSDIGSNIGDVEGNTTTMDEPFVNPFEDEEWLLPPPQSLQQQLSTQDQPSIIERTLEMHSSDSLSTPRPGVIRDTSSSSNDSNGIPTTLTTTTNINNSKNNTKLPNSNNSSSNEMTTGLATLRHPMYPSRSDSIRSIPSLGALIHSHPTNPIGGPRTLYRVESSSSNRSISALSDLPEATMRSCSGPTKTTPPTDFAEGVKMINDALHPWVDEEYNNDNTQHTTSIRQQRLVETPQ